MGIKKENYEMIRKTLMNVMGNKCAHCGAKDNLEFDHIIPSGTMTRDISRSKREWGWFSEFLKKNLQILCRDCNKKKGDSVTIYHTKGMQI